MDEVTIRLPIEPLEEGGYVATSPDVPGLVAEGRTIVESCLEHGDLAPAALSDAKNHAAVDLKVPVLVR